MANFKLTSNADYIVGTSGNDVIEEVISGNLNIYDFIDGGNGLDVIVVDEPSEDFLDAVMALEFLGIDSNSAIATIYPDVKNIEKIQFTDLIYTLADGKIEPVSSTKPAENTTLKPVSFAQQKIFEATISPYPHHKSLSVADVNGDGKLDVITGYDDSRNVSVLLNKGNDGFFHQTFDVNAEEVMSVATGDFNLDNKIDIVTANGYEDNSVSILLGNGKGGFSKSQNFPVQGLYPHAVKVDDFNGDSKPDLIIANTNSDNVSLLLGDGKGRFLYQTAFSVGEDPRDITVGDFNGDKHTDIATANYSSENVSVLLGDGEGNFAPHKLFNVGSIPNAVIEGNFDDDDETDLLIANTGDGSVSLLSGDGQGNFDERSDFLVRTFGSQHNEVLSSDDFNGDGWLDIIVVDQDEFTSVLVKTDDEEIEVENNSVSVLLGQENGTFTRSTIVAEGHVDLVNVGDFNNDEKPDLVIVDSSYSKVSILLNTTEGEFTASIPKKPIYKLSINKTSTNEGETVTFKLTTENVEEGTEIPFTFSGSISTEDVLGGFKTNSFVVDAKGNASLAVKFLADKFTDGQTENLTLTLDSGESQNVTVKDTSLTPKSNPTPTPNPTPSTKETILETRNPYFVGKNSDADNVRGSVIGDDIQGNIGSDILKGGEGDDTIDGGNDNDQIFGEDGDDKLKGGAGNDSISGGAGEDSLEGTEGNDTLDGGADADKMIGGLGNDIYYVDNQKDVIEEATNSQGGNDTAFISIGLKWQNNFSRFVGVENFTLTGDKQDEFDVAGDDNANILTGNIGNNRLYGNGGNDTLIGNEGNDTLEGGAGIDLLKGGAGDDTYLINNEEDTIEDTQGVDTIQSSETITLSKYTTVESLKLTGNKPIKGTGNTNDNLIDGNDASNILFGKEGDDTLQGHGGDDTLIGDAGNDSLDGGDGEDTVRYSGIKDDYAITFPDGRCSVIQKSSGETDELVGVEFVEFSDTTETLGVSHSALQLSISDVQIQEGNKANTVNAKLILTLDNPATETFTVDLNTEDGTATAGKDYRAVQKSVTFNEGEKSATLQIPIVSDKVFEADENFTVQMSNLSSDTVEFNNTSATITILNDDKPTLSFKAVTIAEGQKGKANAEIIATLSETISQPVKVHYQTVDGTALSGKDFDATVSDLIIPANTKNATVLIPILDDKISEATEKFTVKFSQPENALLPSDATAVVTITDNDSAIAIIGTAS